MKKLKDNFVEAGKPQQHPISIKMNYLWLLTWMKSPNVTRFSWYTNLT